MRKYKIWSNLTKTPIRTHSVSIGDSIAYALVYEAYWRRNIFMNLIYKFILQHAGLIKRYLLTRGEGKPLDGSNLIMLIRVSKCRS